MKGIIYAKDFKEGISILDDIASKYLDGICGKRQSLSAYQYIFMNGDEWTVCRVSENCRGRSCNIAYIDRGLGYDIITQWILPTVKSYPFTATHYFGEPIEGEEEYFCRLG